MAAELGITAADAYVAGLAGLLAGTDVRSRLAALTPATG
jgi:hypothetical protein